MEIASGVPLTAKHDYYRRDMFLLRVHAEHAEELLEGAVLPNEVIADLREWFERRTLHESRGTLHLRVFRLGDVVPKHRDESVV